MKMMHLFTASAALLSLPVLAAEGDVQGDAAAGKEMADKVCAACHGMDGNAIIPTYPDLAGQNAPYLVYALQAYKDGQRQGGNAGIMQAQATGLSKQDMQNLAAYYSSLPAK